MTDAAQKPLPFVYQFAAGAVAGVSEVCLFHAAKLFRLSIIVSGSHMR
jgi:solute carrier family 25 2-oxodicarboxylate transporter 21